MSNTKTNLELLERGLSKGNLSGCFELNEAFLLKTALNTLTEFEGRVEKSSPGTDPTWNFDPVKRSWQVAAAGLRKGNLKGAFELDESYALKKALTEVEQWILELEKKVTTGSAPTAPPAPRAKVAAPAATSSTLPKVVEVDVEEESEDASGKSV